MVFSVRGRQRFEGFHSWKVQCCLWLCPTSLFLVVFETLQLFAMSQSQAKRDFWRYQMVTCQINKVFQNAATGSRSTYISLYIYIYNYLLEVLVLQWVLRRDGSDVFFLLCGQHHRRNIWHFICAWLPSLWIIPAQRKSTSDPAITLESFSTARRWKPLQTITVAKWNPRYRQIW